MAEVARRVGGEVGTVEAEWGTIIGPAEMVAAINEFGPTVVGLGPCRDLDGCRTAGFPDRKSRQSSGRSGDPRLCDQPRWYPRGTRDLGRRYRIQRHPEVSLGAPRYVTRAFLGSCIATSAATRVTCPELVLRREPPRRLLPHRRARPTRLPPHRAHLDGVRLSPKVFVSSQKRAWRLVKPGTARRRPHSSPGLAGLRMEPIVVAANRLPQLTSVKLPDHILAAEAGARARLLNDHGIEIGAGLGALAGKTWRIGLMGHNDARVESVDRLNDRAELRALVTQSGGWCETPYRSESCNGTPGHTGPEIRWTIVSHNPPRASGLAGRNGSGQRSHLLDEINHSI